MVPGEPACEGIDAIRSLCDAIWVVTSQPAMQIKRLIELRGRDAAEANRRMAAESTQAGTVPGQRMTTKVGVDNVVWYVVCSQT